MSKSKPILLCSTKAGSGKSIIAIGMFLKLKEEGFNPGYFKAIGDAMDLRPKTKTDKDVNVITAAVARKFSKEEMINIIHKNNYFDNQRFKLFSLLKYNFSLDVEDINEVRSLVSELKDLVGIFKI